MQSGVSHRDEDSKMALRRRDFVLGTTGSLGSLFMGCGAGDGAVDAPVVSCPNPFAGGERVGLVGFVSKRTPPFGELVGNGHDGRLYTDLSTLTSDTLIVPNERFYVRTRAPDRLDLSDPERVRRTWRVAVSGRVRTPRDVMLSELTPLVAAMGATLLECSGNSGDAGFGLMGAARWSGVPLSRVLAMFEALPGATQVLVSGFDEHTAVSTHSTPGASWIFSLRDLAQRDAWLVTRMNDVDLPLDHGFPLRLVVPGWYGCCCIKWVNEIRLVGDDEPSTAHMREFASRTHQSGEPALAREFLPATIDQAAMPVRIERWRVSGRELFKVVGIMWGGYRVTEGLEISFNDGASYAPVSVCPAPVGNTTWTLWSHAWSPTARRRFTILMRVNDRNVATRRLDTGFYARVVDIT